MPRLSSFLRVLLLAYLTMVLAACGRSGGGGTPAAPATDTSVVALSLSVEGGDSLDLAPGARETIRVFGIRSDGSTIDLTDRSQWEVTDGNTVSVRPGELVATNPGRTNLVVRYGDLVLTVPVVVRDAALVRLLLDPPAADLYPGQPIQFRLQGVDEGERTVDLTDSAQWVLQGQGATLDPDRPGRIMATADPDLAGTLTLEAAFGDLTVRATVNRHAATLRALDVGTEAVTLRVGERHRPDLVAWYEVDGELTPLPFDIPLDWVSADPTVATVEGRDFVALAPGETTLVARWDDFAIRMTVTVPTPRPQSLEITTPTLSLAVGQTLSLRAFARYDDGQRREVTTSVGWSVDDPTLALVGNGDDDRGRLTALATGQARITARLGGLSDTLDLTITPATLENIELSPAEARVRVGETFPFQAIGHYSDGRLRDLSTVVDWTVDDPERAHIASDGRLTPLATGRVTVVAVLEGQRGEATAIIDETPITDLRIDADDTTIILGTELTLRAIGQTEDGLEVDLTGQATWRSGDTSVLIPDPDNPGRFIAVGAGQTVVGVRYDDQGTPRTALLQITVVDTPLDGLALVDEDGNDLNELTLASGTRRPLRIEGLYGDDRRQDLTGEVTLSLSDEATATLLHLDDGPWLLGAAPGTTTLTMRLGEVENTLPVTVTGARLTAIDITPAPLTVPLGGERSFAAIGRFEDEGDIVSFQNLTNQVVWTSLDPTVAPVSNGSGREGRVTGLSRGETTVQASFGDKTATVTVIVTDDPQAVAGLSLIAEPNAIVDFKTGACLPEGATPLPQDQTTLRVRVHALGEETEVLDGTPVTVTLTYPDGTQDERSLTTTGGVVETTLASPGCLTRSVDEGNPLAVIDVRAEVESADGNLTFVRRMPVLVVESLSYLFTGRAWVLDPVTANLLPAGTRFSLLIVNLSNRAVNVTDIAFYQGEPTPADLREWIDTSYTNPSPTATRLVDKTLGEGGQGVPLPGGTGVIAGLQLPEAVNNDGDFVILYAVRDPASGAYAFWGIYPDTQP